VRELASDGRVRRRGRCRTLVNETGTETRKRDNKRSEVVEGTASAGRGHCLTELLPSKVATTTPTWKFPAQPGCPFDGVLAGCLWSGKRARAWRLLAAEQ
jgi:NAD(P)H-hydrate repair Nnr-like enzyme with NAD(P)H-hydrate dehydratase domain